MRDTKDAIRRLWWQLTSADDDAANAALELLGRVVNQMTEEEVAALGDNPPLFAPARREAQAEDDSARGAAPSWPQFQAWRSAESQPTLGKQFNLDTNTLGIAVVAVAFVLVLIAGITITLRLDRQKS